MVKYTCECPYCGEKKTHIDYTTAMCEIPHDDTCMYKRGGMPTKMITKVHRNKKGTPGKSGKKKIINK